jgi:hypothetical protein
MKQQDTHVRLQQYQLTLEAETWRPSTPHQKLYTPRELAEDRQIARTQIIQTATFRIKVSNRAVRYLHFYLLLSLKYASWEHLAIFLPFYAFLSHL